jgi:hypothetical protein
VRRRHRRWQGWCEGHCGHSPATVQQGGRPPVRSALRRER